MPNDPYQIGEDNSGITLVLSDRGVSIPSAHASSHLTGGSDAIQLATASQVGLMSAVFATKLTNIEELADVTDAVNIASSIGGATAAAAADGDLLPFLDVSTSDALKKTTLANLRSDYLNTYYVTPTGTQTLSNKTLTSPTINGGSLTGTAISLTDAALTGILPVAKGGTGVTAKTGTGNVVLSGSPTLVTPALGTPTQGSLISCLDLPIVGGTTGTLSVARGGTGATTLTGVLKGSGTLAITAGTVALTTEVSGVLPLTNGGTGASTLSSGVVKSNGTVLSSSAVGLTTEVTGVLPVANGGTSYSQHPYGQISGQSAGDLITGDGITVFSKLGIETTLGAANLFDSGSPSDDNVLRYTGAQPRQFLVFASTDIMSSVLGDTFAIKLSKNDILIDATECQARTAGKTADYIAKLVTNWIVELSPNDYLELWVAAPSGDAGTPQRMRLVATPV